jgi:hypothetical protein
LSAPDLTKFAADFVQEMRALVHQAIIDKGGGLEAQPTVLVRSITSSQGRIVTRPDHAGSVDSA